MQRIFPLFINNQTFKAMDFRSKKIAYNKMQAAEHLKADQALLKKLAPNNPFASREAANEKAAQKLQREILWVLLDIASIEAIEENRKEFTADNGNNDDSGSGKTELELKIELINANCAKIIEAANSPDPKKETLKLFEETNNVFNELPEENRKELLMLLTGSIRKFIAAYTGKLTANLEKVQTSAEAIDLLNDIIRLASMMPEEASNKIIEFANSKNPIPAKIEALKAFPLNDPKCDFKQVDAFFKFFGLTVEGNQKKDKKIAALQKFLENNVPKTPEEIKEAHLGALKQIQLDKDTPIELLIEYCAYFDLKVDAKDHGAMVHALKEFRGDIATGAGNGEPATSNQQPAPDEEKEELKEKLEESEEEKADLEEQNEELQEKVDELEAEKKSGNQVQENEQKS